MSNQESVSNLVELTRGSVLVLMFDTPVPVDYGGVYDVMARLKVLKSMGYELELLCTAREADRLEYLADHLAKLVPALFSEIHVLEPRSLAQSAVSWLPLSASIRKISIPVRLQQTILQRQYEFVLVEHLKMAGLVQNLKPLLKSKFYLRMHNDEAQFYLNLSRESPNLLKKLFFFIESIKYLYFQKIMLSGNMFTRIFFISSKDFEALGSLCADRGSLLPIAFDLKTATAKVAEKSIDFLYVGNLESDDNVNALHLALEYLSDNSLQGAVIAVCGRCRNKSSQLRLKKMVAGFPQLQLEFNISPERLKSVNHSAKFFLNFSTNSGGVKTKLIDALSHDLGVLTNEHGIAGSGLDDFCIHVNDKASPRKLKQLLTSPNAYEEYLACRRTDLDSFVLNVQNLYLISFTNDKP